MKSLFKKFAASLVALILVFAMFTGVVSSALPTGNTINAYGQDWEILEDEIYGAYESLSECVEDLEPEDCEEVDMDDSVWSFQLEVAQDWWYSTTYYYTQDGPVKDNYACITPQALENYLNGDGEKESVVEQRLQNYASSVALDNVDERLALTLRGPWTANNGQAKFIFKAPKSGYVVLYNEGQILGATKDSVFKSFSDPKGSGYVELCIKKNDTIISEVVKISIDSMSVDFPKAGTTGRFKVTEGDEIEVHLRAYDHTWENNTVFIDPVVAYTEVIEDEAPKVDDLDTDTDTTPDDTSTTEPEKNATGISKFLALIFGSFIGIIVFAIVCLVIVVAVVVVVIVLIKKKKSTPDVQPDEAEASAEENKEEKIIFKNHLV